MGPDPIKPHPEQPIRGEKLNPTGALAPQDGHLMPKGDQLEFQAGAATKAEREQRDEGRNDRGHAHHATAMAQESLDRKSTRLNSSHRTISYAVFCLKKKIH